LSRVKIYLPTNTEADLNNYKKKLLQMSEMMEEVGAIDLFDPE